MSGELNWRASLSNHIHERIGGLRDTDMPVSASHRMNKGVVTVHKMQMSNEWQPIGTGRKILTLLSQENYIKECEAAEYTKCVCWKYCKDKSHDGMMSHVGTAIVLIPHSYCA